MVQFFEYAATLKNEGFQFFLNPLYTKTRISLRINNFESNKLKVNDVNANQLILPQWSYGGFRLC